MLRTYPEACRYCAVALPQSRIQAQFSLVFAVAVTLLHRTLASWAFQEASLADPVLRELMSRIRLESWTDPPGRWAELCVQGADGVARWSARVDTVPGDLQDLGEEERLMTTRVALLAPVLGERQATELITHWWTAPLDAPVFPTHVRMMAASGRGASSPLDSLSF